MDSTKKEGRAPSEGTAVSTYSSSDYATPLRTAALDYVRRGWALTWMPHGSKFPPHKAWNTAANVVTDAAGVPKRWNGTPRNIGLVHALGAVKTCSLDVDKVSHTRATFAEFGIDLDEIRQGVPCVVGNPENFRLLFVQPPGLDLPLVQLEWPDPTDPKKKITVFELRAGANQDVLPPSLHPLGIEYQWAHPLPSDPSEHPTPPAVLLNMWQHWAEWEPQLKAACPWARPATPSSAPTRTESTSLSVIDAFNAVHDVRGILEQHGYQRRGEHRYLPPNSTSGVASVRILDTGMVYSSNGSCPLNDGHGHDAFDCWRILEHGGEVRTAVREAARLLGMDTQQQPKATAAAGAGGWPRLAETLHDDAVTMAKDYCKSHAGTWWIKSKDDCEEFVFLANFTAEIVAETTLDDGAERRRRLEITGAINGRPLPTASVASGDFAALGWVGEQFGSAAHIAPGHGLRDRLRYAIQVLSTATQHRTVYQHTGWREIAGQWLYLTPTAVIGAAGAVDGIDVDLPGTLADYALRPGAGEAADAARASLGMLACAPASIAVPLFLAPYRAMLGEALPGDFSLFLSGVTGSRKTELAAICQAHFGDAWHGKRLPAAWSSTPNSLERAAFLAKDAVMVVDDFCPTGTTTDIARFHTGADRLLRAQGNRAGRQRMNADGTLRPAYYPRGLIVATGEDIPRGQSLRGRLLILEFDSHTVDLSALSTMQNHAATGRLAAAAGAFAQWLAPRMGELKKTLPVLRNQLRNEITATAHSRHPDTLAGLVLTAQLFAQFAAEHGITLPAEWQTNITNALLQAGVDQQQAVASEEPAGRFVRLIHSGLSAGLCHVRRKDGLEPSAFDDMKAVGWQLRQFGSGEHAHDEWIAQGPCIGWFDESGLYLDPDAAYRSTARYASEQGQALPLTPRALFKALDNKGHLRTKNPGRTTVKQRFGDGTTKSVLHLHPIPMRNCGNNGNNGNNGTKADDSYEENVFPQTGTASGTTGTTGTNWEQAALGAAVPTVPVPVPVPDVPAMFPQGFEKREQKNACNPLSHNDISQPVPVVPVVPANAHIPPNKFDGVNIPSGWEKF